MPALAGKDWHGEARHVPVPEPDELLQLQPDLLAVGGERPSVEYGGELMREATSTWPTSCANWLHSWSLTPSISSNAEGVADQRAGCCSSWQKMS